LPEDNYFRYGLVLGEKPTDRSAAHITSKAEILTYLRGSFALGHRAAVSLTKENILTLMPGPNGGSSWTQLEMVIDEIEHAENHYGQLVEYCE
jgi:hypothetical protein